MEVHSDKYILNVQLPEYDL